MKALKNMGWFICLYIANIVVEIDILCNVIFLFGQYGETISSHMGRCWPNSLFARFIDKLFFWQKVPSHCRHAIQKEKKAKNDLLPKKPEKYLIRLFMLAIVISMIIKVIRGQS